MGWANICRRRLKVFGLALVIYLDYKAVQKRAKWMNKSKREGLWMKTHERNARRLLDLMIQLEGLWVKLGQYLSTRADVLPEAYISLLRQLQDSLPPRPLKEVKRTIEEQLGNKVEDLFSKFFDEPLATASIAQVHRATLKNGQEVVVKVQHEGIKRVILEDLKNAKAIINWIAWAEPQYNFNPLIDEWCREAPKELDFNIEADNTRRVSENLRCKKKQGSDARDNVVDVLIPDIIQSTEKVLILEYMDGIRMNDYDSWKKLPVHMPISCMWTVFFNGDPHPGNFLVSKEPPHRPILLDFGLTKSISVSMKQALAKMFLASVEGNHVALLSAFAEMGLKLRVDIPEQAMDVTNVVFRTTTPANEALENMKALADQRTKNMKAIQEKMKLSNKEMARFNPVDAFPGDAVIFFRVINLLRGLSSSLNVRIVYQEIMRPFAESTMKGLIGPESLSDTQWINGSPVQSDVEAKLRKLLVEIGKDKVLGVQVCAYKDGKVIIDTAAGVLGRYDPRPVELDSLFPVFSVTKGLTAGLVHWLADRGKLSYDEAVANIWPGFGELPLPLPLPLPPGPPCAQSHLGLANAMGSAIRESPLLMCDWEESLKQMAAQQYHYLSFGWLCGGIIEHSSGRRFQDVLEEAIVQPLGLHGELYIGIPPGVEARLATLTIDQDDIASSRRSAARRRFRHGGGASRSLQCAQRAPRSHPRQQRALLGSRAGALLRRARRRRHGSAAAFGELSAAPREPPPPPHLPSEKKPKKKRHSDSSKGKEPAEQNGASSNGHHRSAAVNGSDLPEEEGSRKMFCNPKILDAFQGVGDYSYLTLAGGKFGLGFGRFEAAGSEEEAAFGHSGMGGSTGFCDVAHDFAIAVTVNKMSLGGVTRSIVQLVCSELGVPIPQEFAAVGDRRPDMQLNLSLATD
ncbi:unnamed protein product [Spirodela intermedia]|uniref:Uncharacterized protein n=1 Tax=Spirodela intermedia TaxID=51605 RepID=A0A7I8JPQ5_SPIIN|nr:unnamed protein product [Spirodela intermedia]CAA6672157.1 unnamed protein product [Spirodela intermedia]